ncbi:DnaJ domain-containing protein, partial [Coemansia spiralis]
DLYKLLGISAEAGEKELTRAYRIKALKYHPDKNRDNPEAVQLFHSIKAAYDLLTDTKKRAEYDEQRRAQLAKRQRQDALSGHRKKMKSQLEEDEHKAQQARGAERMRAQNMRDEAARFREESLREEWRRDKTTMEDVDELDRSVRIRWDSGEGAVDRGLIAKVFASFGEIEEVVLAPVSEHGRKRNIANAQQSALVVFKSIASAHALMNVQHESPRLQRFSRFWAAGKEPDAVRNI